MRYSIRYLGALGVGLALSSVISPALAGAEESAVVRTVITGNEVGTLTSREHTACDASLTLHLPDVNPDDEAHGSAVRFDGVRFELFRIRDAERTPEDVARLTAHGVSPDMLEEPVSITVPAGARTVDYTGVCDGLYVLRTAQDVRFAPVEDKLLALPFVNETGAVITQSAMGVKLIPVTPPDDTPEPAPPAPASTPAEHLALTGSSSVWFAVVGVLLISVGSCAALLRRISKVSTR